MSLSSIWRALAEPSLTRRLLLAQMGLLVVLWLGAIGAFIYFVTYENNWYEPQQLRARTDMILSVMDGMTDRPEELRRSLSRIDEFQREDDSNRSESGGTRDHGVHMELDDQGLQLAMNAWLGDELIYETPHGPGVVQVTRYDEFEISQQNGRRVRSFARRSANSDARVAILLPADGKAVTVALWSRGIFLLPLLIAMPLLLLPALVSVWLALRPFRELAGQVANKGAHDLEPLQFRARHRELRPLVHSVNDLLRRIREGMMRERRFVADAAHELRTPIAAVGLNVEALRDRLAGATPESPATRSLLASLLSSSQRAARLVAQLLALMRSDSPADGDCKAQSQQLDDIAQETLAAAAPLAKLTDVELELQADATGLQVRGDREGLTSLLQNLIENAIKYSPPHGRVLVRIGQSASGITLTIQDEGPGIPAEFHERVFERFYRIPSQMQTGSGLGLAIVRTIADRLGATISLDTAAWGHGLLVRVEFPGPRP